MAEQWLESARGNIRSLYESGLSCAKIAELKDVTPCTVGRHLVAAGVRLRDPAEIQRGRRTWSEDAAVSLYLSGRAAASIGAEFGVSKTVILLALRRRGVIRKQGLEPLWLAQAIALYVAGIGGPAIARQFGVSHPTLYSWFVRRGIDRRQGGSSRPGEANPNWKGGRSYLPYPARFNRQLKEKIRKRDGYCCAGCGMSEDEHRARYPLPNGKPGQALTVHHIDYDKQNCDDGNLITLCHVCNPKANKNRGHWQAVFTRVIEERRAA